MAVALEHLPFTSPPASRRLAQRINPAATWDGLVLPEPQTKTCREIAVHVRQQLKVYDLWGFAAKCSRACGLIGQTRNAESGNPRRRALSLGFVADQQSSDRPVLVVDSGLKFPAGQRQKSPAIQVDPVVFLLLGPEIPDQDVDGTSCVSHLV